LSGFFEQGVFDEANRHRDDCAGIAAWLHNSRDSEASEDDCRKFKTNRGWQGDFGD
jgi:hypothetical protein